MTELIKKSYRYGIKITAALIRLIYRVIARI
ncbi:hypothetical protein HMPREF9138_01084 [Prevotella histicola F0411]|uniref:Uncharacterized protein n=1 Tax=Prevotella histicola F0411 TaxID=857291 RepID=G6AG57_9BACT|nr:hypothetical protein HMPREF9138_01084 [Prevotella histicola F0411]